MATVFELLIQIIVQRRIGKPNSSKVFTPKGGSNKLGVLVGVVVSVLVGVFVGALVGVCDGVAVAVGVLVGVFVAILVAVFVGVSVGVLVGVSVCVHVLVYVAVLGSVCVCVFVGVRVGVSVSVLVAVGVLVEVAVGVLVGARTVTVSRAVLFTSLPSGTLLFGSMLAVFGRLPAVVGVTVNVTLNDAPAENVTIPPLASQLKAVPVMEQLIVPVGGVLPSVTNGAP